MTFPLVQGEYGEEHASVRLAAFSAHKLPVSSGLSYVPELRRRRHHLSTGNRVILTRTSLVGRCRNKVISNYRTATLASVAIRGTLDLSLNR